jgi:ubiquinone/menaquinone biosynthesis C-methylase UbiE
MAVINPDVSDAGYRHPRLAAIYDALDPDRSDLDVYVALIEQLGGHRILDLGCGTGTLALMLADRGHDVVGVDPAAASLDVARAKPGAERVRWIDGDAAAISVTDRDIVILTGNAVQAITEQNQWHMMLRRAHQALVPGGHLVFETRDPAAEAWTRWTAKATYQTAEIAGVGDVTTWLEVTAVQWPLVTFQATCLFESDGERLISTSTLRFRTCQEVTDDLRASGFESIAVRDAPDRPNLEFVFIAQRTKVPTSHPASDHR